MPKGREGVFVIKTKGGGKSAEERRENGIVQAANGKAKEVGD